MKALHVLAFALAFTIDVRVKAETALLPNSSEVLQDPKGCILQASICAVKTRDHEKYKFAVGASTVVLDANSSVIRLSGNAITLLSGTVWIRGQGPFSVRSEFGVARSEDGEFWVARTSGRMTVSATGGALVLEPRGSKVFLRIDSGEENWIGGISRDGVATTGVPQAIPLAEHLRRWARLFPGTKREFEKESRSFHSSWSRGLASVASYHETLAEERRQAVHAEAEQRAQARAQEEARSKELRALFRRKVLLD